MWSPHLVVEFFAGAVREFGDRLLAKGLEQVVGEPHHLALGIQQASMVNGPLPLPAQNVSPRRHQRSSFPMIFEPTSKSYRMFRHSVRQSRCCRLSS